jgi:1,4-alpha-glucan branching enzyme
MRPIARWASVDPRRVPISIYEVHAGSWQRDDDDWFLTGMLWRIG